MNSNYLVPFKWSCQTWNILIFSFSLFGYIVNAIPDGRVHVANMGPTWVLSAPGGPMLAPWTLLLGIIIITVIINIITIIMMKAYCTS